MQNNGSLYEKTVCFREPSLRSSEQKPVGIFFIHGGAWVDPDNTPNDFSKLCDWINGKIDTSEEVDGSSISMFGIEYRLSPTVKHPTHLMDVITNIYRTVRKYNLKEICLVGHSVGATLIWQILSFNTTSRWTYPECIIEVKYILPMITKAFLLDGIYSVSELLNEYPSYDSFVSKAFDKLSDFQEPTASIKHFHNNKLNNALEIHIIHSYQDELLTLDQTKQFVGNLLDLRIPCYVNIGNFGLHNEVYQNRLIADYIHKNI